MRCPACNSQNPPEFPPEEWPYCMECGAQLPIGRGQPLGNPNYGTDAYNSGDPYYQPEPQRPDPYRQDPYQQQDP